jgi:DNA-binding transcriptional ArsR family regulator
MEQPVIQLRTEKELKIFMDPLRQRMLRAMEINAQPLTAKKLADKMEITPSAAKHHLTQLESIGVVEKDHTEQVHGITAQFYRAANVEVRIGMETPVHRREKVLLAENLVMNVFSGFVKRVMEQDAPVEQPPFLGDMTTGVLHLTQAQADELYETIKRFTAENALPGSDTVPIEYALIAYRAEVDS